MNQPPYNRILEQSEGPLLCIEVKEPVRLDAYKNSYLPHIEKNLAEFDHLDMLFYYPDRENFLGWEEEAADLNLQKFTEFGRKVHKIALVDAPEKVVLRWNLMQPLFGGEVKTFEKDQFDQALAWVKD